MTVTTITVISVTESAGQVDDVTGQTESPDGVEDYKALYEKEVQRTKSWDGRLSAKERELQELRQRMAQMEGQINQAASVQSPTQDQTDDIDDSVKQFLEEFPELATPIQKMIDKAAARHGRTVAQDVTNQFEQRLERTLKPIATTVHETAVERHMNSIRSAHSDFEEIVKSGDLQTWINEQPHFVAPALQQVYDQGQTQDVIDLLAQYKSARGRVSQVAKQQPMNKPAAAVRSRQYNQPLNRQSSKIAEDDFEGAWAQAMREGR